MLKGRISEVNGFNITVIPEEGEKIVCFYDFKLDNYLKKLRFGDVILGQINNNNNNKKNNNKINEFIPEPLILLGNDPVTIKRNISVALSIPNFEANTIYNQIDSIIEKNKGLTLNFTVADYLDMWAESIIEENNFEYEQPNLNKKEIKDLSEWWYEERSRRRLNLLGINNREIRSEHDSLKTIYEKALSNPFRVVSISMQKAEYIFKLTFREPKQSQIICGMVARKLKQYLNDFCFNFVPIEKFKSIPNFDSYLKELKEDYQIELELDGLYLPHPLRAERNVSNFLKKCFDLPLNININTLNFTRSDLNSEQIEAIKGAFRHSVVGITGGAGTGKTTIIKEIVHNLEELGISYILTSFTGKSVERLKKITERKNVATMDRYIVKFEGQVQYLIIDESSMVSTELFNRFIQVYNEPYHIIFVGDVNQLPPISWGSLFHQISIGTKVPWYRLNKNHRSDAVNRNGIVENAQKMIDFQLGKLSSFEFVKYDNFIVVPGNEDKVMGCLQLFKQKFGNVFDDTTLKVIAPYNASILSLNAKIRKMFNPNTNFIKDSSGKTWYKGSIVMMTENKNDLKVYNGSEGIIIGIDHYRRTIDVSFYNGIILTLSVDIKRKTMGDIMNSFGDKNNKKECDVKDLVDSYAITIHKSQGSEWEYIILYLPKTENKNEFINFNLLYTAITRARKTIWCIGDPETMTRFAKLKLEYRYDNLSARLNNLIK